MTAPETPPAAPLSPVRRITALLDDQGRELAPDGYGADSGSVDDLRPDLTAELVSMRAAYEGAEALVELLTADLSREAGERARLEDEVERLRGVLAEVLRTFAHRGHPGEPCLSSGWQRVRDVERWRREAGLS